MSFESSFSCGDGKQGLTKIENVQALQNSNIDQANENDKKESLNSNSKTVSKVIIAKHAVKD